MNEKTPFEKVVSFVMSNEKSELDNMTAERDYALHCLEREISIAHQAQARIETLEAALREIADQPLLEGRSWLSMRQMARAVLEGK